MRNINKKKVDAAILIIGNEILSGRTQDLNVSFLSDWLNKRCGISVEEVRVIPDVELKIVKNILDLKRRFNYVFTTGGIGPTHDDITAKSLSRAFKTKYEYHKEAYSILENYYGRARFNDGRKKMAKMPRGSSLIYNPVSAAPGFIIKNVFVMAGVPQIFEAMVQEISLDIESIDPIISKTIKIFKKESEISERLWKYANRYQDISIGSYPFNYSGVFGVEIVLSHTDRVLLNKVFNEILSDFNEPNTN